MRWASRRRPRRVSHADAFGLWEDVLEALGRESARTPVFWLIEDLHAADAQTIELLSFLAHPLRALSALIVATVRTGDRARHGGGAAAADRLVRDGEAIALERLGEADVAALAERIGGRALPPDPSGPGWPGPAAIPSSWWSARGPCAPGCPSRAPCPRRCGRWSGSGWGALPRRPANFWSRARCWGATSPPPGGAAGRPASRAVYRWALTRAACRTAGGDRAGPLSLPSRPGARRHRGGHARARSGAPATRAPRRRWPAKATGRCPGRARATPSRVGRDRAGGEGRSAAGRSSRAVAALEAEAARDRSFALWQRWLASKSAAPTPRPSWSWRGWPRRPEITERRGAPPRAASALAKRAHDPTRRARAALAQGANPRPGIVDAPVRRWKTLSAAGGRERAASRRACCARVWPPPCNPPLTPSVPLGIAREAIVFARESGDEALLREVLFVGGSALTYFADARETHAIAGELLALSLAAGDSARALRAYTRRIVGHLELGDFAAFDPDADRMLALARAIGHPSLVWRPLLIESMRALAHGNFEESERFVTEVEQMAVLFDDPALRLSLPAHKAYRDAGAGRRGRHPRRAGHHPPVRQRGGGFRRDPGRLSPSASTTALQPPPRSPRFCGCAQGAGRFPDAGDGGRGGGPGRQRGATGRALTRSCCRSTAASFTRDTSPTPTRGRPRGSSVCSRPRSVAPTRPTRASSGARPRAARWGCGHGWRGSPGSAGACCWRRDGPASARALLEEAASLAAELGMSGIQARARRALGADRDPATAPRRPRRATSARSAASGPRRRGLVRGLGHPPGARARQPRRPAAGQAGGLAGRAMHALALAAEARPSSRRATPARRWTEGPSPPTARAWPSSRTSSARPSRSRDGGAAGAVSPRTGGSGRRDLAGGRSRRAPAQDWAPPPSGPAST